VSELAATGAVTVPALCSPFPNLADVARVFRDLGRESVCRRKKTWGSYGLPHEATNVPEQMA